jgi:glutamate racemase
MRIGFFDSGIGGLTVLAEALDQLPGADFRYFADTASVPYGDKPRDLVRQCVFAGVERLARQGLDALVVACNTATSVAIEDLRRRYPFPILGMEPAVKPALRLVRPDAGRVLVLATDMTLREQKFHRLVHRLDADDRVDHLSLQRLVRFAEALTFAPEVIGPYLREATAHLDLAAYAAVVLGCTHFPYYRQQLARLFPAGTALVDGHRGTLLNLLAQLGPMPAMAEGGRVTFLESGPGGDPERFHRALAAYRQQAVPCPAGER